ncbi:hypothetical protein [Gloeobacter violaceus]|uniref:hypothetical protein n=1 Tax=Gloeobacter violaceus TaxID=33072 RepID=UPI0002EA90A7|nr:hypothetical protein [Gloeobacter violaceus]
MLEPRNSADLAPRPLESRAVFTGSLVDVAGTLHSELVTYMAAGLVVMLSGYPVEGTAAFFVFNFLRGLFFTGLGGYMASRTARSLPLRHALLTGIISLAVSIFFNLDAPGGLLSWPLVLGLLAVVPVAVLGGLLANPERNL